MQLVGILVEKRAASSVRAWLETAVLTLLVVGAGWAVDARDPFFVQRFPWVLLAPLLLGLQNGTRHALVSSLALVLGAFASWRLGILQMETFPLDYAVSVGLLGPLAGEYRDTWQRAHESTRRENQGRGRHLEQFTRAYHLLKRSHDELEQRLAGGGPSLQATLDRVQQRLESAGPQALTEAGDSILQLFHAHGQVQVAALHAVRGANGDPSDREQAHGMRVIAEPVAMLGKAPAIDLEHPMVLDALARRELTSVREDRVAARGPAPLACVPLADASGRVWAVVMVHEMPFLAMRDEPLTLLAVLGGRVGDWLATAARAPEETGWPEAQPSILEREGA